MDRPRTNRQIKNSTEENETRNLGACLSPVGPPQKVQAIEQVVLEKRIAEKLSRQLTALSDPTFCLSGITISVHRVILKEENYESLGRHSAK
eukprot:3356982-Pleurochrysis_carterae.AAC.2